MFACTLTFLALYVKLTLCDFESNANSDSSEDGDVDDDGGGGEDDGDDDDDDNVIRSDDEDEHLAGFKERLKYHEKSQNDIR